MATPRTPRRGKNSDQTTPSSEGQSPVEDAVAATDESFAKPLTDDIDDAQIVSEPVPQAEDPAVEVTKADPENEPEWPTAEREPEPERQAPVEAAPVRDPDPVPVATQKASGGTGFLALVLGGLIAAGIGFAVARYVVPPDWPTAHENPLKAQVSAQATELAEVKASLGALPPAPDLSSINAEIAELRAGVETATATANAASDAVTKTPAPAASTAEDLTPKLEALEVRIAALEQRPTAEASVAPEALGEVEAAVATLRADLEQQKTEAAKQAAEAEAAQAALVAEQAKSEAAAKAVLVQANVTQITAALQSGAPFTDTLDMLAAEGIDAPAPLPELAETGVPTLAALTDGFAEPARAALEAGLRDDMGTSVSERLGSFLRSQTGARSLTPRDGDDPDAVLSRAEAALRAGDLPAALNEVTTLPEASQAALEGWVTQAKLRIAAQEAVASVAAQLDER